VITGLVVVLWVATGALAVYGLALTALDRPAARPARLAVGVVVALLVVQALIAVFRIVQGVQLPEPTEVVIYLGVAVCVLPFVTQFAMAEPNRWGGAIIAAGAIATAIAIWRLQVLWVPLA
jgi:predicted membrane channel-forming protein YqfA (hemolysin III family)